MSAVLKFNSLTEFDPGIIFSMLSESFAEVLDDGLKDKMRQYDSEAFGNPDTVGACALISSYNGRPVGMISWDPRQGPELGIIGWGCVLPEYQGKGFAKAQIKEVLGRLKRQGFKKVFVRTGDNPFFTNAQKTYASCGFREVRRYPTSDQPGYGTIDYEIIL